MEWNPEKPNGPARSAVTAQPAERLLYHGSAVRGLTVLEPRSVLHGASGEKVVYLSGSIPYALLYIWDGVKNHSPEKWVTGGIRDGGAFCEEQFPDQLRTFYGGVCGLVYGVQQGKWTRPVCNREQMYYSEEPVPVCRATEVTDVYRELLHWEEEGAFRVLRFTEASPERQAELTNRIADYILQNGLLHSGSRQARFLERYFQRAWEKAGEKSRKIITCHDVFE